MDLCDDISYAVHDLEDFIRTGVITAAALADPPPGFQVEITAAISGRFVDRGRSPGEAAQLADRGWKLSTDLLSGRAMMFEELQVPYRGTTAQQADLSALSSFYIESFLEKVSIQPQEEDSEIFIDNETLATIMTLKTLVRQLVINKPSVQLTQMGQRRLVRRVFDGLVEWISTAKGPDHYPGALAHVWDVNYTQTRRRHGTSIESELDLVRFRTVADFIATLTETQLVSIDRQLSGATNIPVLGDWII